MKTEWQTVPKNMGERLGEDFLKALFSSDYDTLYVERVNAMLSAAPKPEPVENVNVEDLQVALNYMDRTKAMEFYNGTDRQAILQAARLWLRKQGE